MSSLAAIVALLLGVVCLATVFGWRTVAHWRSTGTTGFLGVAGGPGSPAWWGGLLFVLSVVLMLAAPILALTGWVAPPTGWPHPLVAGLGGLTALTGSCLALRAQHDMGLTWRIGVDTEERTTLITSGVFGYVRNPFFTAMVTVAAGLVALVPTVVSALALVCLVGAVELQVRRLEEPYLRAAHGQVYITYATTTGRFLPWVGRLEARPVRGTAGGQAS